MKKIIRLSLFFAAIAAGNHVQAVVVEGQKQAAQSRFGIHDNVIISPMPTEAAKVQSQSDASTPRSNRNLSSRERLKLAAMHLSDMLSKVPATQYEDVIEEFLRRMITHQTEIMRQSAQAMSTAVTSHIRVQDLHRTDGLPEDASPGVDGSRGSSYSTMPIKLGTVVKTTSGSDDNTSTSDEAEIQNLVRRTSRQENRNGE